MRVRLVAIAALLVCGLGPARAEFHYWERGEMEMDRERKELLDVRKSVEKSVTELKQQLRQITKVATNAQGDPNARERLQTELDEMRKVEAYLRERLGALSLERANLVNSNERKVLRFFQDDPRIPSRGNLSGLWVSSLYLPGWRFRIEQVGDSITGHAMHPGCIGYDGPYAVTGTYREGKVVLTIKRDAKPETHRFVLMKSGSSLYLRDESSPSREDLRPAVAPLAKAN